MAQLMFPDVAGSFQQGFQNGQNMQFNRLAGAAMQNPDQRAQLLGQAGAINPGAALQIHGVYAQQAEQQQAAQRAQQADAMKKIGGAARYMLSALQTKDPNQIEGAYQAVRPYLAELGQAQGKTPPPNWDPSMVPAIYQAAAATASAFPDDNKLQVVAQGSTLLRGTSPVYTNPAKPQVDLSSGLQYDPMSGTAKQIPLVGAPAAPQARQANPASSGDPMDALIAQANQAVQMGADPNKVQAWLMSQAQAGGMQPIPASGQTPQAAPNATQATLAAMPSGAGMGAAPAFTGGAQAPPMTVGDYQTQRAAQLAKLKADQGDSGMELLTQDGKVLMDAAIAHGYNMPMPSMGYGKAGTAAKAAAINALAAKFKAAGTSPDDAISLMIQGKTATSGLTGLQKTYANISGWENSASKQADIALDMSNKVSRTGIPIFNSWLLAGRQATGDTAVAQFNNTVNTLAEEYAKVMSGGSGNVAATDSARTLAHRMLNNAMTADQFSGVVAKMRQEMAARTQALQQTIATQRGNIVSNEGANMGGWDGQAAPAQPRAVNQQTGQAVVWNGTAWVPEQ